MYTLYGNTNGKGMEQLDQSEDKEVIIDRLGNCIGVFDKIDYIIKERKPDIDEITRIRNYDDYINYKYGIDYQKTKKLTL